MAVIDLYTEGAKCSKIFSILNQMVMDASLKLVAASGKKGQDLKRKKNQTSVIWEVLFLIAFMYLV